MPLLTRLHPADVPAVRRHPVDAETLAAAAAIVADVRDGGARALRAHAERLGDLDPTSPDAPLVIPPERLRAALDQIDADTRDVLEHAAASITAFAGAQRRTLVDLEIPIPGADGSARATMGHRIAPVDRAGCYAPGGRYPLPSSVLMTACTARAAGVREVWVASPRPAPVTLAAAAIAGADGLLAVGGAHAVAALAYGLDADPAAGLHEPLRPCDAVVGPGNRWVTAAKQLVSGTVAIDMLAGPSEVLVIADASADPAVIAADMLAQCEHDADASAILVALDPALPDRVEPELAAQLEALPEPNRSTARAALANAFAVIAASGDEAVAIADRLAPEHLQVETADAEALARRLSHYGALFVGAGAAEVLGDYGLGPNHTLPTGGTARSTAGLSVFTFLRARTFIAIDAAGSGAPPARAPRDVCRRAAAFARLEGLEAHARAAERRL